VTQSPPGDAERKLVQAAIVRLRARLMALVFGMVGGVGLLVATLWLAIRGGPKVGQHLGLLANYFPGYEVTWTGSLIGFCYGALTGAVIGWSIASIYNYISERRPSS
jgi:hypothetical protein